MRSLNRDRQIFCAFAALIGFPGITSAQNWVFSNGQPWTENWTTNFNWSTNSFPNSATANVTFPASSIVGGSQTVLLNSQVSVSTVHFNSYGPNGYTLGGAGTLFLAATGGGTLDVSIDSIATIATTIQSPASTPWTKVGSGTLVLTGTGFYSGGAISVNGGTLRIKSGAALNGVTILATALDGQVELDNASNSGQIFFGPGSLAPKPEGVIYSSAGNNTWNGTWAILGANQSAGVAEFSTLTLNGSIVDPNDPTLNGFKKVGKGTLMLNNLRLNGLFDLAEGRLKMKPDGTNASTSVYRSLTVAGGASPTAKLDVTNNKSVIRNGNVALTRSQLLAAYAGGAWSGNGITSSLAEADAAAHGGHTNLSLGFARGDELLSWNGASASFGGQTLAGNDIAIGFTVIGDTNLDGLVDITNDFANIVDGLIASGGLMAQITGAGPAWSDGDFDFNGVIDVPNDFKTFVSGYNSLGQPLGALNNAINNAGLPTGQTQAMLNIVATVPEPASIAGLVMAVGLLSRTGKPNRRRRAVD